MDPLGKGLESLIPDREPDDNPEPSALQENFDPPAGETQPPAEEQPKSSLSSLGQSHPSHFQDHFTPRKTDSIFWIEVDKIEPNPFQPRREFDEEALKGLASSIREHGLLQPVLVTKREMDTPTGMDVKYQLIAGERRWRASQLAGLSQIPAVIRRGVPDDRIRLELALIENVQREDLNPMERAKAFRQLIDEFHMVQREIAERIGKSREHVANTMRLLSLPSEIQESLHSGRITEGHARAVLISGDDLAKQMQVYHAILEEHLNVREAENKARQVAGRTFVPRRRPAAIQDPEVRAWQKALEERLGTRVHFQRLGERGKIVVEFFSEEELRGILGKLIKES